MTLHERLLRALLCPRKAEALLGDLEEEAARVGAPARWIRRQGLRYALSLAWRAARASATPSTATRHGARGDVEATGRLSVSSELSQVLNDIRYGARVLRRSPIFAAAAIATLAVGIGATTAIFAIFEKVVINPLPISDADRVVSPYQREGAGLSRNFGFQAFLRFKERTTDVFGSVAASGDSGFRIRIGAETRLARAAFVTEEYFEQLGVSVCRGREFRPEEHHAGAAPVAIVTDAFWGGRMGADSRATVLRYASRVFR